MILYATGAYGREAKRDDWAAGKDFFALFENWAYFSIRDIDKLKIAGYTGIYFGTMCNCEFVYLFGEKL